LATIYENEVLLSVALANGDVKAFDTLYQKYYDAVYANILKLVRQPQAAEDILQEVFGTLWVHREKISRERSVAGWLFVVSYNKSLKFLHKAVREKVSLLGDFPLEIAENRDLDSIEVELQLDIIDEAINKLPTQKRLAFTLCKMEGKTYEEAARILGISAHTVKEYLQASSRFVKAYSLEKYAKASPLSLGIILAFLCS
jgi:RNA polymerase sigma-70 factor (ECF subfamily)